MKYFLSIVFIGAALFAVGWLGVMRWNECRRIHPFWYCVTNK